MDMKSVTRNYNVKKGSIENTTVKKMRKLARREIRRLKRKSKGHSVLCPAPFSLSRGFIRLP